MAHLIGKKPKRKKQNKKKRKKVDKTTKKPPFFFLFSDKNDLEIKKLKNIIRPRRVSNTVIKLSTNTDNSLTSSLLLIWLIPVF